MAAIAAAGVTHRYGRVEALRGVDWQVPEGALYALLGPNGAGKTTLMRIAAGALRPTRGRVQVLGRASDTLRVADRQWLGWVAESQRLPEWMTLAELERYLAPLYDTWDPGLATELRQRFELDPARRLGTLSRGEHMKAALLCALAPRPRLLLMDEPFTGMDVVVKDEIVRGLLAACGQEGWTIVVSSHDLAELELLADHVGFLSGGRMLLSAPLEGVRARYFQVEATLAAGAAPVTLQPGWLDVERAGPRMTLVVDAGEGSTGVEQVRSQLPTCDHLVVRPATLRELFMALGRPSGASRQPVQPEEVSA